MTEADPNPIRNRFRTNRFAGAGVFAALVTSSAAAYFWPAGEDRFDPFRLDSDSLLGLVALTMLCLGLVLERRELAELRARPLTVLLGVAVQCTLMPGLAWAVVLALGLHGPIAYGVLLCGCVPGAMASNVLTMTARGNVSYSVSLTTVATLLSPLTVPATLTLVAGIEAGADVFKPGKMALTLLLSVVAPVVIGYVIKRRFDSVRRWANPVAAPIATVALLWIIASVVASNRERLAMVAVSLLGGLAVMNLMGYLGGFAVGRLARMPAAMCRALTLEVGMQNAGLGTALAASLISESPEAQIPTAAYTFGCMFTGTLVAAYWSRHSAGSVISDP